MLNGVCVYSPYMVNGVCVYSQCMLMRIYVRIYTGEGQGLLSWSRLSGSSPNVCHPKNSLLSPTLSKKSETQVVSDGVFLSSVS